MESLVAQRFNFVEWQQQETQIDYANKVFIVFPKYHFRIFTRTQSCSLLENCSKIYILYNDAIFTDIRVSQLWSEEQLSWKIKKTLAAARKNWLLQMLTAL